MESIISEVTGKRFSRIGLGCVTFGREIDKAASFAMMDYALECGITFFDTAAAYGSGSSESIIGEWLVSRYPSSDSVSVATKILPPFDSISINNSINKSLERLNKDTIDLVFFHRWDKDLKDPGAFASLADLIKEKKVRMLGVSNFNTQQLTEIIDLLKEHDLPEIKFIQNNNNFAVSDISDDLYRICLENKILIMTYSPLAAGFLTGKHQDGIGKGTRFEIIPGHKDVYFKEAAFRRLDKLNSVASNTGYSPVHLALAWALHQRSVTTVLIGGRTTAHIDQALAAMDFNYPEIFKDLDSE